MGIIYLLCVRSKVRKSFAFLDELLYPKSKKCIKLKIKIKLCDFFIPHDWLSAVSPRRGRRLAVPLR